MTMTALLTELATLQPEATLYQHDEQAWSLFLADREEIYIDLNPVRPELVFSTDIALEPVKEREAFFKFLLMANHAWRSEDFCFLALSEDEKYLTLIRAVGAKNLDVTELCETFHQFDRQRQRWQNCSVNFSQEQSQAKATDEPLSVDNSHHIRV